MVTGMSRGWARLQAVAVSGSVAEGLMLTVLPLPAVSITTDPREVSLVQVVGQAPWPVFSLLPLGALTGGLVASWTGLRSVWLVAAAIQVVALAVAWRGMSPRAFAAAEGAATAVAG